MPERPKVYVHLLPDHIPPGALQGGIAVVVDVLRASTMIVHALAAGCDAVVPCLEVDDARRLAADLPPGRALDAATWGARRYLGHPVLEEGAPADLVVLAEDPRRDVRALAGPRAVVLRGRPL